MRAALRRMLLFVGLACASCGRETDDVLPDVKPAGDTPSMEAPAVAAAVSAADHATADDVVSDEADASAEEDVATSLPAGLVYAELPVGTTVRGDEGADFVVYVISRDGRPLVGIYLGNYPDFPGHELAADEVEQRDASGGVMTVSVMRGDLLLSRERLFKQIRHESADATDPAPPGVSTDLQAPNLLEARWGWVETVHAFTVPAGRRDEAGHWVLEAVSPEALALLQSVDLGPDLRASWETGR